MPIFYNFKNMYVFNHKLINGFANLLNSIFLDFVHILSTKFVILLINLFAMDILRTNGLVFWHDLTYSFLLKRLKLIKHLFSFYLTFFHFELRFLFRDIFLYHLYKSKVNKWRQILYFINFFILLNSCNL